MITNPTIMTRTKLFPAVSFLVAFALLFSACSSGQKENAQNKQEFDEAEEQAAEEDTADVKGRIKSILAQLPPPSEVPYLLQATGAEYDQSIVNNISAADKYKSTSDKTALNLGVYASDIAYLSSYNQVQEALNFMNSAKALGDELGLNTVFNLETLDRFENNLGDKDSLGLIVNEVVEESNDQLTDNDRIKTAALILSGSFVEGLYLSTSIINNYPKDILPKDSRNIILIPLVRLILDQEKPLGNMIPFLQEVEQDAAIEQMTSRLQGLKAEYDKLNIEESIRNNRGNELLSDENISNIAQLISEIRSDITS